MLDIRTKFKQFISDEKRYENIIMMGLGMLVGMFTGIFSIAFNQTLSFFHGVLFYGIFQNVDLLMKYRLIIVPLLGGLVVGFINKYMIGEVNEGFGVSQVLKELKYINRFLMKPKLVLIKLMGTIITLASNLSAGRQGPIVYLGGAIGSSIGYKFNFNERKIRILIGCGAAGSIAGVFNTPIAASIFVLEILMNRDCLEYFTPIVISSITSVVITRSLIGDNTFLNISAKLGIINYYELGLYALLGITIGIAAVFYIKIIDIAKKYIKKIHVSEVFHPVIGAAVVVTIGYFLPQIFDIEYGTIGKIVDERFGLKLLIAMFLGKALATAATLGSGGIGGVFLPGLYLGAAFGSIFGSVLNYYIPSSIYSVGTYSFVGMGAMFAAFADAPITATLMLLELTDTYAIILPILLTCGIGSAITKLIYKKNIYNALPIKDKKQYKKD
jgi:CIC family chloride channel protein